MGENSFCTRNKICIKRIDAHTGVWSKVNIILEQSGFYILNNRIPSNVRIMQITWEVV